MPFEDPFALGNAAGGNALGVYLFVKAGGTPAAIQAITDIATVLPKVPLGQVTTEQLGGLQAEIQTALANVKADAAAGTTIPAQGGGSVNLSQLADQLGSLVGLVTTNFPSATGGLVTVDQAIAVQVASNWAAGLTNALAYEKGKSEGSLAAATHTNAGS